LIIKYVLKDYIKYIVIFIMVKKILMTGFF